MGLGGTNEPGMPSLEPARPKPVIAQAAGGVLGAYVARARQDSVVRQDGPEGNASGRGLNLVKQKVKQKRKPGPQKGSQGKKANGKTSKRNQGNGGSLTEAERQQLAVQSQIAEEKAQRYEAMERGEVAADDDCIVDFSNRVPPESAQRRSETPLSTSDSDMSPPAGEQRWHSQGFQRPRSRSPTPDRGYSNRHLAYSNQRASPVYDAPADHPRERASPTYERYRARSQERDSPEYDQAYASGRRRAGLGHEGGTRGDGYPEAGHVRSKATESMVQRHHEEFLKRQEKWQLADDEQQRQRELLKQALPAEQARIKRVLEQAEKQRNEDDAMQERLVDLMMAKAKAERKAKKKAARQKT